MSTRSRTLLLAVAAIGLSAAALATEGPNLGKPVSPQDIAPWDITVMPDGTGLIFSAPRGDDGPSQIWYVDADGRRRTNLSQGAASDSQPKIHRR